MFRFIFLFTSFFLFSFGSGASEDSDTLEPMNFVNPSKTQIDQMCADREAKFNHLASDESKAKARDFYSRFQNPVKPKRKKRDRRVKRLAANTSTTGLLEQSANLGYIPAKLHILNRGLQSLKDERSKENIKNYPLSRAYEHVRNIMAIDEAEMDILRDIDLLTDLQTKGEEFSYDEDFYHANDMADDLTLHLLMEHDLSAPRKVPERSIKELDDKLSRACQQITGVKKSLETLQLRLYEAHQSSKTAEGKKFIQELQAILDSFAQPKGLSVQDTINRFTRFESLSLKDKTKHIDKLYGYCNNLDFHVHSGRFSLDTLCQKMMKVFYAYSDNSFLVSKRVFEDLRILKNFLLPTINQLPYLMDDDHLYSMSMAYINGHDILPKNIDTLRERMILLKEVQKYFDILNNNDKYLSFFYPRKYKELKGKADADKEMRIYRSRIETGAFEPEFSITLEFLKIGVAGRLREYHLYYVNNIHPDYQPTLEEDHFPAQMDEFLDFCYSAKHKFQVQSLQQNVRELNDSKDFYSYPNQVKQKIWTHKTLPFFIRILQESGNPSVYHVCFLKEHPYESGQLVYKTGPVFPLITDRANELFKFSFNGEGYIIPSSWDNRFWWHRDVTREKRNQLMDDAHLKSR